MTKEREPVGKEPVGKESLADGGFSRRKFIVAASAALGGAACAGVPALGRDSAAAPAVQTSAKRRVLHVIGHSHIDAAWLWPWRDGSNLVLTTMRSALDRMKETPGFRYSHSSSAHYAWAERADPKMFAEIRERVREGRWEAVGGWPVEPDCNLPSTESLVRHCLYGKNYFQRALATDIQIGFNPDSFGHPAGLPTLLAAAGYRYYVFMRPQEHEMKLPLLFWWEGPDGARVLALRIRRGYSEPANRLRLAAENNFQPGFDHAAFFLGVGNHGGSVTREQIRQVLEMRSDPALPELRWSTVREFFAAVESQPAFASLPVVKGELQYHSRGVYSAHGEVKQNNRRAERWLGRAEAISVAAGISHGREYPAREYAGAWDKVLFNQFHDIMAGTALYTAYRDTRDQLGGASDAALTNTVGALESLARRVDTRSVKEGAVLAFNPLPWPRRALVEYHTERNPGLNPWIPTPAGVVPITHLEAKDGQKIPLQFRPSDSMTQVYPRISAWVDLPACGYKVFEVAHAAAPPDTAPYDEFFSMNEEGFGISSLKSADGQEMLAAPVGLVVISDPSDTWGHGVLGYRHEAGRPQFVSARRVEDGPVMRLVRHRARWQNSEIVLDVAHYKALDAVELRFIIDWREREQILKLEVPTALASPRTFAKVPGAIAERAPTGMEEPYQDWVAVQGTVEGQEYTVALVNDSTYSYDCKGGLLRTILVRAAPFARHDPHQVPHNDAGAWQDQGRQERRFWLVRGKGAHASLELDRLAQEMQTPAEYVMDSAHEGAEPWERSFLGVTPGTVEVLAIKRAESGEGTVVRVQERAGRATEFTVESAPINLKHSARLRPWEVKTLLVEARRGGRARVREVSLLER